MHYDDIKMCNCCSCGRDLLGAAMQAWYDSLSHAKQMKLPPLIAGRIHGRPYCPCCLSGRQPSVSGSRHRERTLRGLQEITDVRHPATHY